MTERDEMLALAEKWDRRAQEVRNWRERVVRMFPGYSIAADLAGFPTAELVEAETIAKALRLAAGAGWGPIVRPLEWREITTDEYAIDWRASTSYGATYSARAVRPHDMILCAGRYHRTLAEAQLFAQADHERRILSALDLPPPTLEGG